jgi:hypothetical protein
MAAAIISIWPVVMGFFSGRIGRRSLANPTTGSFLADALVRDSGGFQKKSSESTPLTRV